ncbi:hypothetical protein NQ314_011141 [Rhamnusium bicolor]|uniref:tetrahydrofolate synthase n=1 Tax=Rhamnusium bicolor TaxID=1586634 RepID=A0AAV8XLQ5_9CUCU|nr:hypothetical protein NQ314_011141 [Rhamnusium bicolor]
MPVNSRRDYQSAIETLNSFQTKAQGNVSGDSDKLTEMRKYLHRCGITLEKLDELSVIHVTGTHGKGSTCAYCECILRNHGYRTGFYSSPHLLEVRERIRIDGKPLSKDKFAQHFWDVYDMLNDQKEYENDMPVYFRFLTTLAFYIFLKSGIDVAIIEVGIGGEFDCTNVIRKTVAAGITPISIDHTALLGTTVESIAWHKGGIMKEGSAVFSVEQSENILNVLLDRSKERKCSFKMLKENLYVLDNGSKIPPHVKKTNASLALALSEAYMERNCNDETGSKFSFELAARSIEKTSWPGRYEIKHIKNIRFFLDGAHTVGSIKTCSNWFKDETSTSNRTKALIFNLTGPRNPENFLNELAICDFDVAIFIPNVGYEKETADTANFKLTTDTQLERCQGYKEKWLELEGNSHRKSAEVFASFAQALEQH